MGFDGVTPTLAGRIRVGGHLSGGDTPGSTHSHTPSIGQELPRQPSTRKPATLWRSDKVGMAFRWHRNKAVLGKVDFHSGVDGSVCHSKWSPRNQDPFPKRTAGSCLWINSGCRPRPRVASVSLAIAPCATTHVIPSRLARQLGHRSHRFLARVRVMILSHIHTTTRCAERCRAYRPCSIPLHQKG